MTIARRKWLGTMAKWDSLELLGVFLRKKLRKITTTLSDVLSQVNWGD